MRNRSAFGLGLGSVRSGDGWLTDRGYQRGVSRGDLETVDPEVQVLMVLELPANRPNVAVRRPTRRQSCTGADDVDRVAGRWRPAPVPVLLWLVDGRRAVSPPGA